MTAYENPVHTYLINLLSTLHSMKDVSLYTDCSLLQHDDGHTTSTSVHLAILSRAWPDVKNLVSPSLSGRDCFCPCFAPVIILPGEMETVQLLLQLVYSGKADKVGVKEVMKVRDLLQQLGMYMNLEMVASEVVINNSSEEVMNEKASNSLSVTVNKEEFIKYRDEVMNEEAVSYCNKKDTNEEVHCNFSEEHNSNFSENINNKEAYTYEKVDIEEVKSDCSQKVNNEEFNNNCNKDDVVEEAYKNLSVEANNEEVLNSLKVKKSVAVPDGVDGNDISVFKLEVSVKVEEDVIKEVAAKIDLRRLFITCQICGQVLKGIGFFKKHLTRVHFKRELIKMNPKLNCHICGINFHRVGNVVDHIGCVHNKVWEFYKSVDRFKKELEICPNQWICYEKNKTQRYEKNTKHQSGDEEYLLAYEDPMRENSVGENVVLEASIEDEIDLKASAAGF